MSLKQQKPPTKNPTRTPTEYPHPPKMPKLKTIGGATDTSAIDSFNGDHENWYFNLRTMLQKQYDDINGRLDALEQEVATLKKSATL